MLSFFLLIGFVVQTSLLNMIKEETFANFESFFWCCCFAHSHRRYHLNLTNQNLNLTLKWFILKIRDPYDYQRFSKSINFTRFLAYG